MDHYRILKTLRTIEIFFSGRTHENLVSYSIHKNKHALFGHFLNIGYGQKHNLVIKCSKSDLLYRWKAINQNTSAGQASHLRSVPYVGFCISLYLLASVRCHAARSGWTLQNAFFQDNP